jgi:hypothetical protein
MDGDRRAGGLIVVRGGSLGQDHALSNLTSDKSFRLDTKGYVVKRSKGKGASGFVAQKVT